MNDFKDKIESFAKELKQKLFPYSNDDFTFSEKENLIFYFSKFSFILSDFKQIFSFVDTVKKKTFQKLIDPCFKLINNNYLEFPTVQSSKDSDKVKIMIVTSLLFLHYYSCFGYDTQNCFDQFYNKNLAILAGNYKINVKNEEKFKQFVFLFYSKFQKEINNNNYKKVLLLSTYYNPDIVNNSKISDSNFLIINDNELKDEKKNNKINNKENNVNEIDEKKQNTNSKLLNAIKKIKLTHLFEGKEKMMDIVYSIRGNNVENLDIYDKAKRLLEHIHNYSKQEYLEIINQSQSQTANDEKNKMNIEDEEIETLNIDKLQNSDTNHSTCFKKFKILEINDKFDNKSKLSLNSFDKNDSSFSSRSQMQTSFSSDENCSIYSKRLFTTLTKCDADEETMKLIEEISSKIDENYLDDLINKKINCSFHEIKSLMCYVVEITPQMIRKINGFQDVEKNLTLRFIVPAKEIYNKVLETYFSLYDLYYTNMNTFYFFTSKYIKATCLSPVYEFCKLLTKIIAEKNTEIQQNMDSILNQFYDDVTALWDSNIQDKAKVFNHFTSI